MGVTFPLFFENISPFIETLQVGAKLESIGSFLVPGHFPVPKLNSCKLSKSRSLKLKRRLSS